MVKLINTNKYILSRTLSYSLCSPIEVIRQNNLVNKTLTIDKFINGFAITTINSYTISNIFYRLTEFINIDNVFISLIISVLLMNIISIPLIYNQKRIIVGYPLEIIPIKKIVKLYKLSIIDGIIDELIRYKYSNYISNKIFNAIKIGVVTYPFDIIKSKIIYDNVIIFKSHDPLMNICRKILQNYIFLQMFALYDSIIFMLNKLVKIIFNHMLISY
jgi:hypothetical protein